MTNIAFTAPHHAATEAGMAVLRQGGNAVDAMIAAAATIAVVYPHMNSWGGDGFWIIQRPGEEPVAIDACGYSALLATPEYYAAKGCSTIPSRGGDAALTMAGTVAGWQQARLFMQQAGCALTPLCDVFADAIGHARQGVVVTDSLQAASKKTFAELHAMPDFAAHFLADGKTLCAGDTWTNPGLAHLLERLAEEGLGSFYRGSVATVLAEALTHAGSPLRANDFNAYQAQVLQPLTVTISHGDLFNLPAPTQGIASLLILAIYDRVYQATWTEAERVHHLVECIKQAFMVRDRYVTDPGRLSPAWDSLLDDAHIDQLAAKVKAESALPWPHPAKPGDTVWMGALDSDGTLVSFIQSVYWEFGSGVVIPEFGLIWNNRGTSFSLEPDSQQYLQSRSKPFHTLNPALALLNDGRRLSYGTMGGEGQPQTQAAVFSRYIFDRLSLPDAVARPRWLLGRTWGENSHNLKLEASLAAETGAVLAELGHDIQTVADCTELMGHAGGICLKPDGSVEAATDPRSDGAALIETV